MRLEILVQNEEPRIFPLDRPKIIIGSGETADIEINEPGVSRKHLMVINEDENFFVVDQGSTNGSFINEERLIPGRRTELTSFFPVRLGDHVLVSLLSDEEAMDFELSSLKDFKDVKEQEGRQQTTRVISFQDMQKANTEALVQQRRQAAAKKRAAAATSAPKKKKNSDKERMNKVYGLVVAILLGAIGIQHYTKEPESPSPLDTPTTKSNAQTPTKNQNSNTVATGTDAAPAGTTESTTTAALPPEEVLISEDALTPKSNLRYLINDIKCFNETEKYLCSTIKDANKGIGGVIQSGTMLNIIVDGSSFYEEAKKIYKEPSNFKDKESYDEDLKFIAFILFVYQNVPQELDDKLLNNLNLTFILFHDEQETNQPLIGAGMTYEGFKRFRKNVTYDKIERIFKNGTKQFQYSKDFIRFY